MVGVAWWFSSAVTAVGQGRTIEYPAAARPQGNWVLSTTPALELGGPDAAGPTEFGEIMGVARLANGDIVVADASNTELRVFRSTGEFLRRIGRKGQGPGEFNAVWSVAALGDTIFATDNTGRLNVFAADGTLKRSSARPRVIDVRFPQWTGFFSDGSGAVRGALVQADSARGWVDVPVAMVRVTPDGERQTRLQQRIGYRELREEGKRPDFERLGAVVTWVARGDRFCGGYPVTWEIECLDVAGRRLVRVLRQLPPRRVTEDDRQYYRDAYFNANARSLQIPERAARMREEVRQWRFSEWAPAYSKLLLSDAGELWVSEFDRTHGSLGTRQFVAPRVGVRYSIVDRDGRWLSDLVMPPRFTPYDVGREWVLGVTIGDDDIERVTLFTLRRQGR